MAGNHTVIKRYNDNCYCVMQLKGEKSKGVSLLSRSMLDDFNSDCDTDDTDDVNHTDVKKKHDKKFRESLVRSRTKIFEIAICNNFDMFVTCTVSPEKYDRYNLKAYYKDFSQYIKDLKKRYGFSIQYLLVPEMHEDGAWHIHGMIKGLPKNQLRPFHLKEKLPNYIRNKLKAGQEVYNWFGYAYRFGFCDIEYIRNNEATCKYIVKYITADLCRSVTDAHAKVYYCSQKLKRPEIIASGEFEEIISLPDFQNVYCMKKDFFDLASALEFQNVQFFDSFVNAGLDDDIIQKILLA